MDADARLKALFAEDEPPARDPAFSASVMAEVVRRRFIADMALLGAATAAGGFLLWAFWPRLSQLLTTASEGLAPVAAGLTVAAVAVVLLDGRLFPAAVRNHD